jgi:hypothetical protein
MEKKIAAVDKAIADASGGREDGEDRSRILSELSQLRSSRDSLNSEIQKYRDCDPDLLEELKTEIKMSADGANRFLYRSNRFRF